MAFKRWFGGGGGRTGGESQTVEDLIVLERYDEAERWLKERLKAQPDDLHSHLKLAEVHTALRELGKAIDEYVYVAEEYARDGFYDKGIALLTRVQKLVPADGSLALKVDALQQLKAIEIKLAAAVDGLRGGGVGSIDVGQRVLVLQRLWHNLASGELVRRLAADQIGRLFAAGEMIELEAGAPLAREGEGRSELFWILAGVIEAGVEDAGVGGRCVRTFTARDILGERAMFERRPWPGDYRVTERAVLLRIDRGGLERLLTGNPDPMRLLDVLREQRNDREVAKIVDELRAQS